MALFDLSDYDTRWHREAVAHGRLTFESNIHDLVDPVWLVRAMDAGLGAREFASWRTRSFSEEGFLELLDEHTDPIVTANYRDGGKAEALVRVGEALLTVTYSSPSQMWCGSAAKTHEEAAGAVDFLMTVFPEERPAKDAPPTIDFRVWTSERPFPTQHTTEVTAWEDLAANYPRATRDRITALLDPSFEPGRGGRLLLLFGPPGTGKSTLLCTLAHEWKRHVELTVVADPAALLSDASYFSRVSLTRRPEQRWGLVVLEDSGSLFGPMAEMQAGENRLGVLLNGTAGILGNVSRTLIACTTNLAVDALHAAVSRPGRCMAAVQFDPFPESEAREWLIAKERPDLAAGVAGERTLAELYALLNGNSVEPTRRRATGFRGVV